MSHIKLELGEPFDATNYLDDENFISLDYFETGDLEVTIVGSWHSIVSWLLEYWVSGNEHEDAILIGDIELSDENLPAWIHEALNSVTLTVSMA